MKSLDGSAEAKAIAVAVNSLERQYSRLSSVLGRCGDRNSPITEKVFRNEIKACTGSGRTGMMGYSKIMRDKQVHRTFAAESGQIPADIEYDYSLPCRLQHPGLCRHRDAGIYDFVMQCVKRLRVYLKGENIGTLFQLKFSVEERVVASEVVRLGYWRGGSAPGVMLGRYSLSAGSIDADDALANGILTAKPIMRLWHADAGSCSEGLKDERWWRSRLGQAILAVDHDASIIAQVFRSHMCELVVVSKLEVIADTGMLTLKRCEAFEQLHPAPPVPASSRAHEQAAKKMKQGLDSFKDPDEVARKGVRIRQPTRVRGGRKAKPEYTSGSSSEQSADDDLAQENVASRPAVAREAAETIVLLGCSFTRLRAKGEFASLELRCDVCDASRRCSHLKLPLAECARRLQAQKK